MSNELIIVNNAAPALIKQTRNNYELSIPQGKGYVTRTLKRDRDFGVPIIKTKDGEKPAFPQPILYKGGAELIIKDYQVFSRYTIESAVEDVELGYFFYRFKCSLIAYDRENQREVVVAEGFGSSNTRETKNGNASGFNTANTALKIARKRSMVDAAISLAGLSSVFTQDLENETFMSGAIDMVNAKDDDAITSKQRQRIFAIANSHGLTTEKTKVWLAANGYVSVKDIKMKDFDSVCDKLEALEVPGVIVNAN